MKHTSFKPVFSKISDKASCASCWWPKVKQGWQRRTALSTSWGTRTSYFALASALASPSM